MVSALLGAGHPDARRYPVARLLLEHEILRQRQARQVHLHTLAIHTAVMATVPTKNNAGGRALKDFLASLLT